MKNIYGLKICSRCNKRRPLNQFRMLGAAYINRRENICKKCERSIRMKFDSSVSSILNYFNIDETEISFIEGCREIYTKIKISQLSKLEMDQFLKKEAYLSNRAFKQIILQRDNYTCQYCGLQGYTLDHVIPLSKGGVYSITNCVCSCVSCNEAKGSLNKDEFYEKLVSKKSSK